MNKNKLIVGVALGLIIYLGVRSISNNKYKVSKSEPVVNGESDDNDISKIPMFFMAGDDSFMAKYNQVARDDDVIGFSENLLKRNPASYFRSMALVKKGKIYQNFASYKTAEENIGLLKGKIDGIMYDLEKWDKSNNEADEISKMSQKMAKLAKDNGVDYVAHLGISLAINNKKDPESIERMAQYANAYSPTAYPCLLKNSIDDCVNLMTQMAQRAKKYNPRVKIVTALSLEQNIPLTKQVEFLRRCKDFTDSILIFYYAGRANSAAKFWQIYQMIRGS